jgi:hypothetical protein
LGFGIWDLGFGIWDLGFLFSISNLKFEISELRGSPPYEGGELFFVNVLFVVVRVFRGLDFQGVTTNSR